MSLIICRIAEQRIINIYFLVLLLSNTHCLMLSSYTISRKYVTDYRIFCIALILAVNTGMEFHQIHCVQSVRIRSYSGPYFSAFGQNTERYPYSVRMRENTNQNNSEYGHILRNDKFLTLRNLEAEPKIKQQLNENKVIYCIK